MRNNGRLQYYFTSAVGAQAEAPLPLHGIGHGSQLSTAAAVCVVVVRSTQHFGASTAQGCVHGNGQSAGSHGTHDCSVDTTSVVPAFAVIYENETTSARARTPSSGNAERMKERILLFI